MKNKITLALILITVLFSCQKTKEVPATSSNISESTSSIIIPDYTTGEVLLAQTSTIIQTLYKQYPMLSQVSMNSAKEIMYNNSMTSSEIRVITFKMKYSYSNIIYKTLVFYYYKGKAIPVIITNQMMSNGNKHITCTDIFGNLYYGFQVNSNNKVGKIIINKGIPFHSIGDFTIGSSFSTPNCMNRNTTYISCLRCAVTECFEDWVCAIDCGLQSSGCLAVWGIGCAFHA